MKKAIYKDIVTTFRTMNWLMTEPLSCWPVTLNNNHIIYLRNIPLFAHHAIFFPPIVSLTPVGQHNILLQSSLCIQEWCKSGLERCLGWLVGHLCGGFRFFVWIRSDSRSVLIHFQSVVAQSAQPQHCNASRIHSVAPDPFFVFVFSF